MNRPRVLRLPGISRTVSDIGRAIAFYRDALDFSVIGKTTHDGDAWSALMGIASLSSQAVTMHLGGERIELLTFDPPGCGYPPTDDAADCRFQHIAIVVSDIDKAYAKLSGYASGPISQAGPQSLPPSSGSATAYKFRDPDGHPVELIQFPPGTENAAWQKKPGLFLGIDHSALDVADITQSIDFYTRLLGLRVSSRSVNSGPAQERLDRLRDVHVEVVALRPAIESSPHVELLNYQRTGTYPPQIAVQPNDIAADRLVMQVDGLASLIEMLEDENVQFISPGCVTFPDGKRKAQIRDPTGHLLILKERDNS